MIAHGPPAGDVRRYETSLYRPAVPPSRPAGVLPGGTAVPTGNSSAFFQPAPFLV